VYGKKLIWLCAYSAVLSQSASVLFVSPYVTRHNFNNLILETINSNHGRSTVFFDD